VEASQKQGLISDLWEQKYGEGNFELATVTDMSKEGAFDEAVKGTTQLFPKECYCLTEYLSVSEVAHVASNLTFDPDPRKVIPEVLEGFNEVLKSAAKELSVKRFVYTSSSTAVTRVIPNEEFTFTTSTWNEFDEEDAWAPPLTMTTESGQFTDRARPKAKRSSGICQGAEA
jgi:hypothetical protein